MRSSNGHPASREIIGAARRHISDHVRNAERDVADDARQPGR